MRMVWCTFSVIGFHKYKGSPKEVAYLRQEHRHKFNFKVSVEVTHDNREIEFHTLKRDCVFHLRSIFNVHGEPGNEEYNFGLRSCEMVADELMQRLLKLMYGNDITHSPHGLPETTGRQMIIEVNEDGECGGIISRY